MSSFRLNVAPDELCQVNFLGELCKVFGQGELCQVISRGVMLSFLVFFRW